MLLQGAVIRERDVRARRRFEHASSWLSAGRDRRTGPGARLVQILGQETRLRCLEVLGESAICVQDSDGETKEAHAQGSQPASFAVWKWPMTLNLAAVLFQLL